MKYSFQSKVSFILFISLISFSINACKDKNEDPEMTDDCTELPCPCNHEFFAFFEETDCSNQIYPNPVTSPYVIPFPVGTVFSTGLTNCSSAFHSGGNPEQHAYDFDMPLGTKFVAARAGEVVKVVEDQGSSDEGEGNYVVIGHIDNSFALYYHAPKDGIEVEVGQMVNQGDVLGVVGESGMAAYPHLQFIVVKDDYTYPFSGLAINFRNVHPLVTVLKSYTRYSVCL